MKTASIFKTTLFIKYNLTIYLLCSIETSPHIASVVTSFYLQDSEGFQRNQLLPTDLRTCPRCKSLKSCLSTLFQVNL